MENIPKKRNGWLTVWLTLTLIANVIAIFISLLAGGMLYGAFPGWVLPFYLALAIFNMVCVIALFRWKKWGFWGECVLGVIAFIANISVGAGVVAIFGITGPLITFGLLHVGKEDKGWPQLS
ncbi:MAG: hypothetical protein HY528_02090 [Chloroflexi bacterium]|nr:hypothetical protein [Chloroflexota bacterium]